MRNLFIRLMPFLVAGLCLLTACGPAKRSETRILVFSKTAGFRHASIPEGIAAIQKLGQAHGFVVDTTEDARNFNEENLSRYSAVVFLNTTGDVLDFRQQADFERYIQAGGGYVGVHAATDTEYDWPWYNKLAGAYFISHPNNPNVREGKMIIHSHDHPSTTHLAGRTEWPRTDEFYNFKSIYHGDSLKDGIIPLISIDEKSYEGGINGDFHPMSWYHTFDGGRAFYTNFGHTPETYSEPDAVQHLLGGIMYAIGTNSPLDYKKAHTSRKPDPSRFVVTVLDENLNEPMELAILKGGKVLFTTRGGELQLYDPATEDTRVVGRIAVNTKHEDGLVGLALDPNFEQNHWLYLYYAPIGDEAKFVLSRFEFSGDSLVMASEKQMLDVATQREECCHTGGSLKFGPDGNLYLSTGDNTNPFETSYAPINEIAARGPWDAQKSSGNMNDLRGKVLRIKPMDDGTYTIPEGNLFPKDGSAGRPEIYVMGCRNPYRISVDSKTGFLYWGDVGPDADKDSTRGSRGYDEVNQARKPGFFGWPYFIGNNYPYNDYDFATKREGEMFVPTKVVNNSTHNTGLQELPPAQPAFIWYPYAESPEFPMVGKGGRNAMAGPVFHASDFAAGVPSLFPAYYENKLFIYDFMRDWVMVVTMKPNGDLESIEPFMPELKLSSPVDMEFGPDGSLYILEYGTRWFAQNPDARLVRIEYTEANRAPKAQIAADAVEGGIPMNVNFTAEGSFDYDKDDQLSYSWDFGDGNKGNGLTAAHTYTQAGTYKAVLTVKDKEGKTASKNIEVRAGNAPPVVNLKVDGNQSFFWPGQKLAYTVDVTDAEDGSLSGGQIPAEAVAISFDFLQDSQDPTIGAQDHASLANASLAATGEKLITTAGCIACHGLQEKIQGPAYREVAAKYKNRSDVVPYLIGKIRNGGSGVWGGNAMPAQAQVTEEQARAMAIYIMSLNNTAKPKPSLPASGNLAFTQHKGNGDGASYFMRVTYVDKGAMGIGPIAGSVVQQFSSPNVSMKVADVKASKDASVMAFNGMSLALMQEGGRLALPVYDLTGIPMVTLGYVARYEGVRLRIHLDSPEGPVAGEITLPMTPAGNGPRDIRPGSVNVPLAATGKHKLFLVVDDPAGTVNAPDYMAVFFSAYFHAPQALAR